jgi:hypothetical protein
MPGDITAFDVVLGIGGLVGLIGLWIWMIYELTRWQ